MQELLIAPSLVSDFFDDFFDSWPEMEAIQSWLRVFDSVLLLISGTLWRG